MLVALSALARRLRPARRLLAWAAIAFAALIAVGVLNPAIRVVQPMIPVATAALLWALCILLFVAIFSTVPEPPEDGRTGLRRFARSLNRAFHWLLALAFGALAAAAIVLTGRLLQDA